MSAPEGHYGVRPKVHLGSVSADVLELIARPGRTAEPAQAALGIPLPVSGAIAVGGDHIVIATRPERWLLLAPSGLPGARAAAWHVACAGCAVVVDLSSGLGVFHLSGGAAREMLSRGCRLDLHPAAFPPRRAAATLIAQVPVTLATLAAGVLLLTPATFAAHFAEWLDTTAAPYGGVAAHSLPFPSLLGEATT